MQEQNINYAGVIHTILILFFLSTLASASNSNIISHLTFKQISTSNGLPSNEVQKVIQDREGFMWFATRYGLCQYDGYRITTYRSNLYTPDLFTNNNILCLADDADHNIWIGTLSGINIFNKETGKIKKANYPGTGLNTISCLLVSRDNTVWVGSDVGLYRYNAQTDSMMLYAGENTDHVLPVVAIKSLIEDSDGDIWIGTWSDGLFRYSPSENTFYSYPRMNNRNSAHVIYEDSRKNIWIGAWEGGLIQLHQPKDMENVSWTTYLHSPAIVSSLSDNFVYDICEDVNTNSLWVGTRSGLSIMQYDSPGKFINYKPTQSPNYIACNEINTIRRDNFGNIWIGSIGGGVFMTSTHKPDFTLYRFDLIDDDIPTHTVRTILVDNEQFVWLGIGTYGVARHDRKTNKLIFYSRIPEFSEVKSMPSVYSILQRRGSGEIWLGTYDGGLYVYKKGEKVKHYDTGNSDFVRHVCVTSLLEDSYGNCWVGTRSGLGVKRSDGSGHLFTNVYAGETGLNWIYVRDIIEDTNGDIWLATTNYGIVRIAGNVNNPDGLRYFSYTTGNNKISTKNTLCQYVDSRGRLWVGTEGHGLFLYDRANDVFLPKTLCYNLPGDVVGSIEEDGQGHLWLGTNAGLVRLIVNDSASEATVRIYTSADGLQGNDFIAGSSFNKNGQLFFGGYKGYNTFYPDRLNELQTKVPFAITDIKIFNRSFKDLDDNLQKRISPKTPTFTEKIELPYKYNNFSIEFASLTYKNPELNKYAYRLDGFDKEWQNIDATRHFAYYNNLKSGTYIFLLKATNENGVWSGQIRKMTVVILPPFWATWWAYLIYAAVTTLIIIVAYRTTKNRMVLENSLQLQKMEQAKAEELNHSKLQFFTNITHELLTPLTIISASVDELKIQAPQFAAIYPIINNNIQRLIRLLQQILEFRKAETGNLRLRVSQGDIVAFVKNEAESFQPLIKKHKLHFSMVCESDSIPGYFDTDKLDKILYNLFSNAAKYNKKGGFIQVNLSYAPDSTDSVVIQIKDNGEGISEEQQKTLFKRFYEGDYRKFNTIGTGIGLSLVKDLVQLHGGNIQVESKVNEGTTFVLTIPIKRSYYKEEEIDEDTIPSAYETISDISAEVNEARLPNTTNRHSILILEDSEELLELMVTLLSREYNTFTAGNGKEGIVIMENEDIDLIISDIMMPEMDGTEFCKHVKGSLESSHIPVILLTAKNKEEDRAKAYESGADGFISKPFNLTVLHARIRNLLKTKERTARDFKNQLVFEVKDLNYTTIDEEFIKNAIDCVNRHLDDPEFDQPQFIDEMGTSKSTLYKKLKSLTGLNTSAFIRNIRLKAAVKIMEEKKGIRVSELAYAVGFNDPKYFSACFKKEFNMLPSDYAERFIPGLPDKDEL